MTYLRWSACLLGLLVLDRIQAEEFTATLLKVADGNVTFVRGAGKKKTEQTLPAEVPCKVFVAQDDKKAKKIDAGAEVADGLKNALFLKLEPNTVDAWIRTNADNTKILEMRIYQSAKKKK